MERTFCDVRVTHPFARSYRKMTPAALYKLHEDQKKNEYNDRIIKVEHGSFTPLIFTTTGGYGPECKRFLKQLATKIADKSNENYADVMRVLRTRLRFCVLRTTLVALRGTRGKSINQIHASPTEETAFNLVAAKCCNAHGH